MNAINLEQSIVTVNSMSDLRIISPEYDGQRIFLTEYYAGKGKGGGLFTGHLNIPNAIDDGGYSTIKVGQASAVWRRNDLTQLSLYDGGCDPTLKDNSTFIQNISLIQGDRSVKIPSGYWNIAKPIIFPANRGIALYGESSFNGRAALTYSGPDLTDIHDVSGVITVTANPGEMTYSGVNFKNFQIIGNYKIIS